MSVTVSKGFNDFESQCSDMMWMWDFDKNTVNPDSILYSTQTKKCWFKCKEGHSFQKSPYNLRLAYNKRFNGCTVCSGHTFVKGVNDFKTKNPLACEKLWDYANNIINPEDVFYNSRDEYFFICPEGHNFKASLYHMNGGANKDRGIRSRWFGCPVCCRKVKIVGENDFLAKYPELAKMWDYSKNNELPENVSYRERRYFYWFVCSKGHSFQSSVFNLIDRQKYSTKGCPVCSGHSVISGVNDIKTLFPERMKLWCYDLNPDVDPTTVSSYSTKAIKCRCEMPGCNNIFSSEVQYFTHANKIYCEEHMYANQCSSKAAREVADLIRSWGILVKEEVHLWKDGFSVDMFLPDFNMAIEYNGLYWHCNVNTYPQSHYRKYKSLENIGVRLFVIWEDDWLYNRDVVISCLRNKLSVSLKRKVNARDCKLVHTSYMEASKLLEENHLQGRVSGEAYIGLELNGELVSVCVIDGVNNDIYLKRFASSYNVRGGFSKILSYIFNTYSFNCIYTFSDNSMSDGSLYKDNGFLLNEELKADYYYYSNNRRVHKFNFRKSRFEKDDNLIYKDGLSEKELADINNLVRIYDYGKKKWVRYNKE